MKLVFLGTRGEIEAHTRWHRRHTATLVSYRGRHVMLDAGQDWRGMLAELKPHAIVLTHAHPDHAWGLAAGAPAPVYATAETWERLNPATFPVQRRLLEARVPLEVEGIQFEAFPVEHSTRAPGVGYRIRAGRVTFFYVPDVVYIHDRSAALSGCALYVGDGASLTRPLVRRRGDRLIGHAAVRTQLGWCEREGVRRVVITHCGSQIVAGDRATLQAMLTAMARERGIEQASFAYDGMEMVLR